jgi:glucose/mannose-6-phosphate isomerase
MNKSTVLRYDPSSMRTLLLKFPDQVLDAVRIGKKAPVAPLPSRTSNVVVTGLGGSAIGGDLLRSYLSEELAIPFFVNRHYVLPAFVDSSTLVIVSSYSGNTEETIAAHKDAIRRKATIVCISSNGETEKLARKYGTPLITIPKGYPPRAAVGYSFFAPLLVLQRLKLISSRERDIKETVALLRRASKTYASLTESNPALSLAKELYGKLPIIYSPADRFDVVNLRWRGQLAENAKVLAFGHVLPEMNHNELVGWRILKRQMSQMAVVFLRDRHEHERVRVRMGITKDIIGEFAGKVLEVESEGTSLLTRMFSLIYLGDWVSYYLALLNGVDPTPVNVIDYLKRQLEKV